jgi:hypothetical protein
MPNRVTDDWAAAMPENPPSTARAIRDLFIATIS